MKIKIAFSIFCTVMCLASCGSSDKHKSAALYGQITIEQNANKMAGTNGKVEYFNPVEKYANKNYTSFGVRVQNPEYGNCEFVYCVDTVSNIVDRIEYAVLDGAKIETYDGTYLVADNENAFNLLAWQLSSFGINFDDYSNIPEQAVLPDNTIRKEREILAWYDKLTPVNAKTTDGGSVTLCLALGYKTNNTAATNEMLQRKNDIEDFIRQFINKKTTEYFSPKNEGVLKKEIMNEINKYVLSKPHICETRFIELDVIF